MAESADGVVQVLDFMRILHDCGIDIDAEPAAVLSAIHEAGMMGIVEADLDLFLTMGFVLRLLIRNAELDATSVFAKTRIDLLTLGESLDVRDEA